MKSFTDLDRMHKRAYQLMGNGRDGLFNLTDAALISFSISSFAGLLLSPVFERAWPGLYENLEHSQLSAIRLMPLTRDDWPGLRPTLRPLDCHLKGY